MSSNRLVRVALLFSRLFSRIPLVYQVIVEPILVRFVKDLPAVKWYGVIVPLEVSDVIHRKIRGGTFEITERRLLKNLLSENSLAIDIGAHCGFLTLAMAAQIGSSGQIHAFEPIPSNFIQLQENTKSLGQKIHLHNLAVVATNAETISLGRLDLWSIRESSTSGNYSARVSDNSVVVNAVNINTVLASFSNVDFIKIDVEGLEPDLIMAVSDENLAKVRSFLFETVVSAEETSAIYGQLAMFLESKGFSVIRPLGFRRKSMQHFGLSYKSITRVFAVVLPILKATTGVSGTTVNLLAIRQLTKRP